MRPSSPSLQTPLGPFRQKGWPWPGSGEAHVISITVQVLHLDASSFLLHFFLTPSVLFGRARRRNGAPAWLLANKISILPPRLGTSIYHLSYPSRIATHLLIPPPPFHLSLPAQTWTDALCRKILKSSRLIKFIQRRERERTKEKRGGDICSFILAVPLVQMTPITKAYLILATIIT